MLLGDKKFLFWNSMSVVYILRYLKLVIIQGVLK